METQWNPVYYYVLFICIVATVAGNDMKCLAMKGGVCQLYNKPCAGTYMSGLCASPATRRCCVVSDKVAEDAECHSQNGRCQFANRRCNNGQYIGAKCSGPIHRRCCVTRQTISSTYDSDDSWCKSQGGACQDTSIQCPGGYQENSCHGDYNRQCCIGALSTSNRDGNSGSKNSVSVITLLLAPVFINLLQIKCI